MVLLHVKRGDESQFLYEAKLDDKVEKVQKEILTIFNGRLKISRLCSEIEELADHGTALPPNMVGLTDEQIEELKLKDEWAQTCIPSGGYVVNKDQYGRRNGNQPNDRMRDLLKANVAEAKQMMDKNLVAQGKTFTYKDVQSALDILKGAVRIVYPMDLPPHDPIRMEFMNIEDLTGTQASKAVIEPAKCQLWFAGRLLLPDKQLREFLGSNEKSKVIIKINKREEGQPGREPAITPEIQQQLMAQAYRKHEEMKRLELDDDDSYLDSNWADPKQMKRQLHGTNDIRFRFGK